MENKEKNVDVEKGLIVCHPDMKSHLSKKSGEKMLPDDMFVTTTIISPEYAFVVPFDDFMEWLWEHNEGLWQSNEEVKQ